jgi:hypothetical protein
VIFAPPVSTKPMKIMIRVYSLSSDDDHGTNTLLFSNELPKTYNDFFELLNEIKDPADSYNIDKHLVEVEGSNIPFIEQIADMTQDGEMLEDENGAKYEFVLENDDAVSTLHALIDEARELVGRKDEDSQDGSPSL